MIAVAVSSISENITELLKKHNLSITKLAAEIQVTVATLSKIINGQIEDPRATTLKRLAQYFNISIDELLGVGSKVNNKDLGFNIPVLTLEQLKNPHHISNVKQYYQSNIANSNSKEYFVCYMDSPAMYPLFDKNTLIIFHKTNIVQNLQYVLYELCQQNEIVLRQIYVDGNDKILKPLNPDFNIIKVTEKDKLIATAVQIQREFI